MRCVTCLTALLGTAALTHGGSNVDHGPHRLRGPLSPISQKNKATNKKDKPRQRIRKKAVDNDNGTEASRYEKEPNKQENTKLTEDLMFWARMLQGSFRPGTAFLGDYVWEDKNGDGIQDDDEPGIFKVVVDLYDCSNPTNPINSTITDPDGKYLFERLQAGNYFVKFTSPAGYHFSPANVNGISDELDSDADVTSGTTECTNLEENENDFSWDAGLYEPGSIGDFVWEDKDGDGIQDPGEPGIPGVTVKLYDCRDGVDVLVESKTTDPVGMYKFNGLAPGSYYVLFETPSGFEYTSKDQGGDDTKDSDADTNTGKTTCKDLESGEEDLTIDAGMYRPATIGDFVWDDLDIDGFQDPGESGIPEVEVLLYDCSDDNYLIGTVFTDDNGEYNFSGLKPGSYYLEFVAPTGYLFSPKDRTSNDLKDSDASRITGKTVCTDLESGEVDLSWDAGLYKPPEPASIGDYVWEDKNGNGIQDDGEPGIEGVTVKLYEAGNSVPFVMQTDADGKYLFEGLDPNEYHLKFTLKPGYIFTQPGEGNDAQDSDADPEDGTTEPTLLESGEYDDTWDAGMIKLAKIGDFVWHDMDGDGLQELSENGIQGVTVELYNAVDDSLVSTETTDSFGKYIFDDVVPNQDYYIKFIAPAGYQFTKQNVGSDEDDSDANNMGITQSTRLDSGEVELTWDAGLYKPGSIGDCVWKDENKNGLQDEGPEKEGCPGTHVQLLDSDKNVVKTTITNAEGCYIFEDLQPDWYRVQFNPLLCGKNCYFTIKNASTDENIDSDADPDTGETDYKQLTSGEVDMSIDAGVICPEPASIGNYVWEDRNGNGLQEDSEPGISGVAVELYNAADNSLVKTDATDVNGMYKFADLEPDKDYYLIFLPPTGYHFTTQNAGSDTQDSDADPITGRTQDTHLVQGEYDDSWDAGLFKPGSIGDCIWIDADEDGIQDPNEMQQGGCPDTQVTLLNSDGDVIKTTTTDSTGCYIFEDLRPATYQVEFGSLDECGFNCIFTPTDVGTDDLIDSDANAQGRTDDIELASGEDDMSVDAGVFCPEPGSIGDFVWEDMDGDGVQDDGEPGIEQAKVSLYDCSDNVAHVLVQTTLTDSNGKYLFTNVPEGDFKVVFDLPDGYLFTVQDAPGSSDTLDSDTDVATGETICFSFPEGGDDLTRDAGMYRPGSIGDCIWIDDDEDGIQNEDEQTRACPGTEVRLIDSDGDVIKTTISNDDGCYIFEDLRPASYQVEFGPLGCGENCYFTWKDVLENQADLVDSDANQDGLTDYKDLLSGQVDLSIDAGVICPKPGSIGDYVWEDLDGDGIQDDGDPGIPGVNVFLYDCNDNDNQVMSTTTNGNGLYLFQDVFQGRYKVKFERPQDYFAFTRKDAPGSTDENDSDADPSTNMTICFDFPDGGEDLTRDAGMIKPASLGDFVWEDLNNNGIQDSGEPGIDGVVVELISGDTTIRTTTTANGGNYLFDNLKPGEYSIKFEEPDQKCDFTTRDAGSDDAVDSDANEQTGQTIDILLESGVNDMRWDAGIHCPVADIGDLVWDDGDSVVADGIQGDGEPGVGGVEVFLHDCSSSAQLMQTTTDSSGEYLFEEVSRGNYYVRFVMPDGYDNFSPQDMGSDDTIDSDVKVDGTGETDCFFFDAVQDDLTRDAGLVEERKPLCSVSLDIACEGCDEPPPRPECEERPQNLKVTYTGQNCVDGMDHSQEEGKVTCVDSNGGPPAGVAVFLVVTDKHEDAEYYEGPADVNQIINLCKKDGDTCEDKIDADLIVKVYNNADKETLYQNVKFHSSCSQNLFLNDRFGSIKISGFDNQPSGEVTSFVEVTWKYTIRNEDTTAEGDVTDFTVDGTSRMDLIPSPPTISAQQSITVSETEQVDSALGYSKTASVDFDDGSVSTCSDSASYGDDDGAKLPGTSSCGVDVSCHFGDNNIDCSNIPSGKIECTERPFVLKMKYNGGDCSQSDNTQKEGKKWECYDMNGGPPTDGDVRLLVKDGKKKHVYYDDNVQPGDIVDLMKCDDDGYCDEIDSELVVQLYTANNKLGGEIVFHSSCSSNLFLGDKFGAMEVVGFDNQPGILETVSSEIEVTWKYHVTNPSQVNQGSLTPTVNGVMMISEAIDPGDHTVIRKHMVDLTDDRTYDHQVEFVVELDEGTCSAQDGDSFTAGRHGNSYDFQ